MIHQDITINGKTATVGYCYATEIAYKDMAGQDINDFMPEITAAIGAERLPDVKKTICLILAAITAYYHSRNEDAPIQDTDLMNEASPLDIGKALGTIISLRGQFYALPAGEPTDSASDDSASGKRGKGKRKN